MKLTRLAGWTVLPVALVIAFAFTAGVGLATQQGTPAQRDFTKELANKMRGTFVVAATGGVLMQDSTGPQTSAAIQRILRDANTTIGHLEFYEADRPGLVPVSARQLAQDLADLGYDALGLGDAQGGETMMRSGLEALTEFKLPVARPDRQPVFRTLPSGRVAFINAPSPVRLTTEKYVTAEQLKQLKAILAAIVARRNDPDVARPIGVPEDLPDRVTIFGDTFVLGPVAGEIREELNAAERQANLMAVRSIKEFADFVALSMPMPPTLKPAHYSTSRRPHDAIVALAHDLVDNGMDMYVGSGNHVVQGVEIYKGRPIFYNLGDLSVHRAGTGTPESRTAVVATATYQGGVLQEVKLYPIDLGFNPLERPASTLGIPMTPSAEVANRILADLQRDSTSFGTKILVENGVGIIRVPREATVAIGQNIKDFGTFPRGGGAGAGRGGRGGRGGGL